VTDADFFSVVTRQRACRAFSAEPVTDDDIARVLDAATRAPSAENRQPWEFVVVRDPDIRAAIGDLTRRAWEAHGRAFSETRLTLGMLAEVERGATGGIAAAPVQLVVCADVERGLEITVASSIFPAVQNLLLAATALGLGSALTTLTTTFGKELVALVGLPKTVVPVAVVPLGWHTEVARAAPPRAVRAAHASRALRAGVVADAQPLRVETDRLVLRRWDVDADLDAYAALCAESRGMRYIGDGTTRTHEESAAQLRSFEQTWTDRSFGLFATELKRTGELIGFVGLAIPDFLPEIMPSVEIGWRLGRAHWGNGYATEGARAALAYGFDRLDLDRIVSVHAVGNDPSGNVMQKIGMHLDRETVHPRTGGTVRVYAIDRPVAH